MRQLTYREIFMVLGALAEGYKLDSMQAMRMVNWDIKDASKLYDWHVLSSFLDRLNTIGIVKVVEIADGHAVYEIKRGA